MNYIRSFSIFVIGVILSFVGAALLQSETLSIAIAICYIGSLIVANLPQKTRG